MDCSVFIAPPHDFRPKVEVAGCFCECEDKILLLKRHPHKAHGGTWGIPGGKFEEGEDARSAAIREIREEVGLDINDPGLEEMGKLYMRLPHLDYIWHAFYKHFLEFPAIQLELKEHLEAQWISLLDAFQLPLMPGGIEALTQFAAYKNRRSTHG